MTAGYAPGPAGLRLQRSGFLLFPGLQFSANYGYSNVFSEVLSNQH